MRRQAVVTGPVSDDREHNRWASHHPSLSSVLCPFRFFTSCGLGVGDQWNVMERTPLWSARRYVPLLPNTQYDL